MNTAQRPIRSKFVGCGDYHARPNREGEDAGCPTVALTSRKVCGGLATKAPEALENAQNFKLAMH